jgi:serine/threonine-protein kinase RsbW
MSAASDLVTWSWPAEASSVSTARNAVVEWLRERGLSDAPLGDVALVVSEAVSNAVVHAYVGGPPGQVKVEVAVHDHGRGLSPRPDSPGLGYGLALMVAVSQRFEAHSREREGTRLVAWFGR